jgi:tetraacyldisaccharide 4'-kinase
MIGKDEKFKRALLWLPARLYEMAVRLRIAAYETDYIKPKQLDATVISVGNITHGGTGKTPMVEYIARYIQEEGHQAAILTRGYGRKSEGRLVLNDPRNRSEGNDPRTDDYSQYGDEPLMLARALPDVPVIIDKDRYEGGLWAKRELGSQVLILDDGYQHLKLARNLNLLLLDATDLFGGFEMAPFGRLREPLYGIKRADVVIITRADRPMDQAQALSIIKHFCGEKVPVMYVYSEITHLRNTATNIVYESSDFVGWNVIVMCGIGNPNVFSEDILRQGINIVDEHFFRDHHAYAQEDLDRATAEALRTGADAIVTTEKDAVRIEGLKQGDVPVYAAQLQIQSEDEVRLKSLLLRTCL